MNYLWSIGQSWVVEVCLSMCPLINKLDLVLVGQNNNLLDPLFWSHINSAPFLHQRTRVFKSVCSDGSRLITLMILLLLRWKWVLTGQHHFLPLLVLIKFFWPLIEINLRLDQLVVSAGLIFLYAGLNFCI